MRELIAGWWLSKTIWFNLLVGAFAVLEASFRFLQPILGDKLYGVTLLVVAVVNMALRVITTGPLSSKSASKQNATSDHV